MNFSYSAIWDDTVALTRRHAPLLAAIAGVFIFLPALLSTVYLTPEQQQTEDLSRLFELWLEWYRAAAPWLFLQNLISMVGVAAMLRIVFAPETTVGSALAFAIRLLPFYFLMSLIFGLIVGFGLVLLILPGLYLWGRLAPAGALMVAENRRGPIDTIGRAFELTRGRGWAILGLLLVVVIVGTISMGVGGALFGIVFHLAAGQELGELLTSIVTSALSAALATLLVMLSAAIYRALAPQTPAQVFE
jgi:hypothetical protein